MADLQGIQNANQGSKNGEANLQVTALEALPKIRREEKEKAAEKRAAELGLMYINLSTFPLNPDILKVLPEEKAKKTKAFPFFRTGKKLRLAIVDPENLETKALIKELQDQEYECELHLATDDSLSDAFKWYQSEQYKLVTEVKNVVTEEETRLYEKELAKLADLKKDIESLTAEEALNALNVGAITTGATDIHVQPEEKNALVRFRIDGVLHPVFELSKETYARLANQLKYKAKMQLNITNVPQDGRFQFTVNERKIDVRVASLPTEFGESFVLRILDSGKSFLAFEELGFRGHPREILERSTNLAQGVILVTGPTSSGKTTTLYALLRAFNKPEVKIITLEDPIEYHLAGMTQSQINEKRNYTFSTGLRSILRQDPDVVMIGEIRDLETAETVCQAALTGHVLLSTLHTNSAVESIPRLIAIGVPPFIIAPSLSTIIAQRLARRVCKDCQAERVMTDQEKTHLEQALAKIKTVDPTVTVMLPEKVKQGKGCEVCNKTGYRGQMVLAETLFIDDELKEAILQNLPASKLFELARKKGMLTMQEDGFLKVLLGDTTLEEVFRVTNVI